MELNLSKQTVSVNEVIYDGVTEQPIECDVLLPDYCPDIQRILRCEVVPSLLSSVVNGNKLTIDGMAVAHLYYLSEDGCIRKAEYKIPYTKVVELRSAPTNPSVTVGQSVDYFNCRAVSQRRLDMRGAVTISVRVTGQSEEQVVSGAEGMGMQLCRDTAENTCVLPQVMRQTSVREEVELGHGKPSIGTVIRYTAFAEVTDYKVISGKLIIKGELTVKIIYQSEEDMKKLEVMEYALPISQIIDMAGVDEDCTCIIWSDVCSIDVAPKRNADGEYRCFALDVLINTYAVAHRRIALDTCCDCYSTQFECKQTQKQVPFLKLIDVVNENCMYKESLDLPPNVKSIIDIWCTPSAVNMKIEQNNVVISGKLLICMFAYEESDEIAYYDQMRDFSHKIPIDQVQETVLFHPVVRADTTTFSMSGHEKMEVRCTIRIKGSLYTQYRKKVICDIAIDESRKKTQQQNVLYLYYAAEREPIWEIAKRYNTSVDAIQAGNELEDTVLNSKTMLLIPMK
ncbi:SPOCS domain-containing protein [Oscillospiraceae bacterium PP1C4]